DQMHGNEKPTYGELKMTIAQFFRVNGGSTQLRGVTPDIKFPITGDFDQNGEQSYDNALPWTSITAADYAPDGDVKTIVPMLEARHEKRVVGERDWQALQADIADARKLRKETTISLNEQTRRAERDEQEAKRKQRHPELADATVPTAKESAAAALPAVNQGGDSKPVARVNVDAESNKAATDKPLVAQSNAAKNSRRGPGDNANEDDGLQADERSLKSDLAEEKKRKAAKDVVLDEAANVLADEVDILHADTKLAARVLPHTTVGKDVVD
ncbi:MAG: carboxy terminal-processing peptidase, partial [Rudaea sp.]